MTLTRQRLPFSGLFPFALLVCMLFFTATPTRAQQAPDAPAARNTTVEQVESDEEKVHFTVLANGEVVRFEEPGTAVRITHTLDNQITVTTRFPESLKCQATITLSYAQLNTAADVDGTIENSDCAASSGDFTIAVSTRDESGELKTAEFSGAWERDDDQPIEFEAAYPIDENVDLVRVRSRRISCVCAEAPQAQAAAE